MRHRFDAHAPPFVNQAPPFVNQAPPLVNPGSPRPHPSPTLRLFPRLDVRRRPSPPGLLFSNAMTAASPTARAYALVDLGLHFDGAPLLPVALNDAGDLAVCAQGSGVNGAICGFFLSGTLCIPSGSAIGHHPVTSLSSNGLTAGVTGLGPDRLRACASHLDGFGEKLWPGSVSVARGINARRQIVGYVILDAGAFALRRGFVLSATGPARFLTPPFGGTTLPTGINDAGDVVFNATPLGAPSNETHAWCLRDGCYVPVGDLSTRSRANAITPGGLVVGHTLDASGLTRAFLWEDGLVTNLAPPGGCASEATAANDRRTVVGRLVTGDGPRRAFRWTPGDRLTPLDDLVADRDGWSLHEAVAINAHGTIAAIGSRAGQTRGFLLKPVSQA